MANKRYGFIFPVIVGIFVVVLIAFVIYFTAPTKPSMFDRVLEFLPRTLAGKSDPPIRRWLYDFQGLFGGLLALAAAALTIIQMRLTDRDAADRHEQVMALAREENKNLIERALNPTLRSLSTVQVYADEIEKAVRSKNTLESQTEELLSNSWPLVQIYDDLLHALNREEFVAGGALFSGILTYKITFLKNLLKDNMPRVRDMDKEIGHGINPASTSDAREILSHMYGPFFDITGLLREIIVLLRDVADRYQIKIE